MASTDGGKKDADEMLQGTKRDTERNLQGGEAVGFVGGPRGGFIAQGELGIDGNSSPTTGILRTRWLGFWE
jgi:hypothetical protein